MASVREIIGLYNDYSLVNPLYNSVIIQVIFSDSFSDKFMYIVHLYHVLLVSLSSPLPELFLLLLEADWLATRGLFATYSAAFPTKGTTTYSMTFPKEITTSSATFPHKGMTHHLFRDFSLQSSHKGNPAAYSATFPHKETLLCREKSRNRWWVIPLWGKVAEEVVISFGKVTEYVVVPFVGKAAE